ncbi:MAG: hypothetical protein RID07_13360, partial [Lacipirellulaceae bacterium]
MTSVRELDRVEDRIRQHRQVEARPILIVEGPDDLHLLRGHLPDVAIFPADGRRNVVRATETLRASSVCGIRGLIDADFEAIPDEGWVLTYEARDLEGMLIRLGVLSNLLEHAGSSEKIATEGGAETVVGRLVTTASTV